MDEPLPVTDIHPGKAEPEGAFPIPKVRGWFDKKRVIGGIVCIGLLFLLFRKSTPEGPHKPVRQPATRVETPAAETRDTALQTPTTPPAQTIAQAPVTATSGTEDSPEKKAQALREEMANQRRQYEMKAAFEVNVVAGHANSTSGVTTSGVPLATISDIKPREEPQATPAPSMECNHNQTQYWLPESTVIEGALDSEVQGQMSGPVDAHITTDVYAPGTRILLLPHGTRMIGAATKVGNLDQARLAITFHRIFVYPPVAVSPQPCSIELGQALPGLSQQGAVGVPGKVNNHLLSLLGAASVVGLIQGASIATYGGSNGGLSIGGMMSGVTQSTSEVTSRILERFLNRLPTITIQPGARIKFELIKDLQVPAFPGVQQ